MGRLFWRYPGGLSSSAKPAEAEQMDKPNESVPNNIMLTGASKTLYDFDDHMLQYMLKWETKESTALLDSVFKSRTLSEVQT